MSLFSRLEDTHSCLLPHSLHTVREVCAGTISRNKIHFKRHSTLPKRHFQHRQKIFLWPPKQSNFRASYNVVIQDTIRIHPPDSPSVHRRGRSRNLRCPELGLQPLSLHDPLHVCSLIQVAPTPAAGTPQFHHLYSEGV